MTNNFINVNVRRGVPGDKPSCFGDQWEEDDWTNCRRCDFFYDCRQEFNDRHGNYAQNTHVPPRSSYFHRTNYTTTQVQPTRTTVQRNDYAQNTPEQVQRPKTPDGYPMGTEYLPPEQAGKSSAFQRFSAMASAEMISATAQQFGHSMIRFFRDPSNYHTAAGQWKYGDKYHGNKKVKYGFSFKKKEQPTEDLSDRPDEKETKQ